MKPIAFIIAAILCLAQAHAQTNTFSYEQADSLSSIISALEKHTEGKTYKNAKGNIYTLSFPGENFKVYFHDRLATKAVYKTANGKEILTLTENIDFSKTTGIFVGGDYNNISYIRVDFPAGHLKTQIIEDGVVTNTLNENYLEFFSNKAKDDLLFNALVDLICKVNKAKGKNLDGLYLDWKSMVANNTSVKSISDFINKHPQSFLTGHAKVIIAEIKAKEAALIAKKAEEERVAKEKRLKEIQNQLAHIDRDLKETRKKSANNILISSLFGVGGAYAAYYGFTHKSDKENVAIDLNTVLGVGGSITSLIGFTYLIAGQSVLYKPKIKSLRNKRDILVRERQSLAYIEIIPYSHHIMANNYSGITLRVAF